MLSKYILDCCPKASTSEDKRRLPKFSEEDPEMSQSNTNKFKYSYGRVKGGRTGVFSWCVISWFCFPWNVHLRNYSFWVVIWRFYVTSEQLQLFTGIPGFTTLFYLILSPQGLRMVRVVYREWLRYVIGNMEPWLSHLRFCFRQTLFLDV